MEGFDESDTSGIHGRPLPKPSVELKESVSSISTHVRKTIYQLIDNSLGKPALDVLPREKVLIHD